MNDAGRIRDSVDLAIIGVGPAGCATAITAAQAGLVTALIEGSPFPLQRPGETLHPAIQPLVAQLGCEEEFIAAGFPRFAGIHVRWSTESRFDRFGSDENGPWLGFQAWQADFDTLLLNRARQAGVEVHQPCRALYPVLSDRRVIGVNTSWGMIAAGIVIDAAGGRHWLARQLEIPICRYSPKLIAKYGYCEALSCSNPLPAIVADGLGWTWYAKVRADCYHWTRLNLSGEAQDRLRPNGDGHTRGADVTWRIVARPAGPGFFTVGDAAAVLDPASSHGVLRAIMSGIMAADAIRQVHGKSVREVEATEKYCKWRTSWFEHDVLRLHEMYCKHASWHGWARRVRVPGSAVETIA